MADDDVENLKPIYGIGDRVKNQHSGLWYRRDYDGNWKLMDPQPKEETAS
jgi:hypothetical protein